MNASTENSAEKSLENIATGKPVSVCSISFAPLITDEEREFIMQRLTAKKTVSPARQTALKKFVFNWRSAAIAAAILTIGILHFAFQMTFIRSEVSKVRPAMETQMAVESAAPVKQEIETPAPIAPIQEEQKQANNAAVPGKVLPAVRRPQAETAPVRQQSQPKRREMPETREERLRRVEKMLTGV